MYGYGVIGIEKDNMKSGHLNSVYEEFAQLLGMDAVLKIYTQFKGQQVNFPVRLFAQHYVISEIVRCYDGTNINALATKFSYSERTVRKILKEHIDKSE